MIDPARVEQTLAHGRAAALARMTSRATIAVELPKAQWPTVGGMQTRAFRLLYADRPCRLARDEASSVVTVGDATEVRADRRLDLPHDTRLVDGAVARIDVGEWAGTFWRVVDSTGKDQATALRVRVAQIKEPEGWGTWA